MKKPTTALLRIFEEHKVGKDRIGTRVSGYIFNDSRGAFPDGTLITTSEVRHVRDKLGEKVVCVTRNGTEYTIEYISSDDWLELCLHEGEKR